MQTLSRPGGPIFIKLCFLSLGYFREIFFIENLWEFWENGP
jgi:hypothetical protein